MCLISVLFSLCALVYSCMLHNVLLRLFVEIIYFFLYVYHVLVLLLSFLGEQKFWVAQSDLILFLRSQCGHFLYQKAVKSFCTFFSCPWLRLSPFHHNNTLEYGMNEMCIPSRFGKLLLSVWHSSACSIITSDACTAGDKFMTVATQYICTYFEAEALWIIWFFLWHFRRRKLQDTSQKYYIMYSYWIWQSRPKQNKCWTCYRNCWALRTP